MTNKPRRIPTDEIEVGRWYRVEDAVPAEDGLRIEELWPSGSSYQYRSCALSEDNAAWRYNGPIPDTLPPREEKPKRFHVEGSCWLCDRGKPFAIDIGSDVRAQEYCTLLNAGHEALEAEREGGAS